MWEIDGNDITDKKCKLAANKRGLKQFGTERRLGDLKGKHFERVVLKLLFYCIRRFDKRLTRWERETRNVF